MRTVIAASVWVGLMSALFPAEAAEPSDPNPAPAKPRPDFDERALAATLVGKPFHFDRAGLLYAAKLLESQWGLPVAAEFHQSPDLDPHAMGGWVRWPAGGDSSETERLSTLEAVAAQVSEDPDSCQRFAVRQWEGGAAFVPTQRRTSDGEWVAVTPVLDTPVSLPPLEDGQVAVELSGILAKALSEAGHATISGGPVWVHASSVPNGTEPRPAREILQSARLKEGPVSWKLLWLKNFNAYGLYLHGTDEAVLGARPIDDVGWFGRRPAKETEIPSGLTVP